MNKKQLIESLQLESHPLEGGYFKRTYTSQMSIESGNNRRALTSSIYYMLTDDQPIGYLHKNASDIVHFYHMGGAIRYLIISPEGMITEKILGPDIANGQLPQLLVRGGHWKAAQLCSGDYGLISEAVSPGFDYADNTLANLAQIQQLFPHLVDQVDAVIKK